VLEPVEATSSQQRRSHLEVDRVDFPDGNPALADALSDRER
jgi:hypothetical protein